MIFFHCFYKSFGASIPRKHTTVNVGNNRSYRGTCQFVSDSTSFFKNQMYDELIAKLVLTATPTLVACWAHKSFESSTIDT